jgi:release factor glutamine methyltransferase
LRAGRRRRIAPFVDRRALREPAAYILGEWGFRRLTLAVDPRVLIPRPGTESVVERCLELLQGLDSPEVLDAGTGSGAIALAIADEHPGARVTAIDASDDALAVARANAAAPGSTCACSCTTSAATWAGRSTSSSRTRRTSTSHELPTLQPELRFEPEFALVDRGQTEAVRAQLATRSGPAARSCSRSATTAGKRSRACSESSATRTWASRRI